MSNHPHENKMYSSIFGKVLTTIGLLDSGEVWSTREATDLFFGITKLFQHKDVYNFLIELMLGCATTDGVCRH